MIIKRWPFHVYPGIRPGHELRLEYQPIAADLWLSFIAQANTTTADIAFTAAISPGEH
jgi:hypothetical protein